jgi:23S rRNA (uracil1939-C5)-methyltransferase
MHNIRATEGERVAELRIESLAYGGDAVGHLPDGRAAFVAGGCPGDLARIEVLADKGRFVRARVVEVLEPSPDRVVAPCPYFGVCGGCTWQHISAQAQLRAKRQSVVDALTRIGRVERADEIVEDTLASPEQYGYRNKIELIAEMAPLGLRLGFRRARSQELVPIESCLLLPDKLATAPKALSGALRYLVGGQDLGFRRVGLRVARNTRDVEIALWTQPGPFPRRPAATTLGRALKSSSITRVLVKGPDRERQVAGVEVLAGSGNWRERLLGRTMTVSAPSFFQINTAAAELLVSQVLAKLEIGGTDRVADLYAGVGTFTLPLAEVTDGVVAVESAGSAVRDLRRNLEASGAWAEVVGGDAARELASLGALDAAVVDPPRVGLEPGVAAALRESGARTVVYVSCDPATLARDTVAFLGEGYGLESVTPVDLFPQSYHIETVATFRAG